MTTRLLLIRHGESEWNAAGRWQGQADPPLTDLGRSQAASAAERLTDHHEDEPFAAVAASDLDRAHTTARIIADILGLSLPTSHVGLRERFAGPWQGLTRAEIDAQWPGAVANRRWPAGYEDDHEIVGRVVPVLADLARAHRGRRVLAVAHGGLIRALDRATGASEASIPNLAGRWYELGPDLDAAMSVTDALSPLGHIQLVGPDSEQNVE